MILCLVLSGTLVTFVSNIVFHSFNGVYFPKVEVWMPVPTFTETVELSAWSIVDLEIMGVLGIDVVPFLSVVLTPFVTVCHGSKQPRISKMILIGWVTSILLITNICKNCARKSGGNFTSDAPENDWKINTLASIFNFYYIFQST